MYGQRSAHQSLIGGVLFGLSHDESFEQAVRIGMATSAITSQTSDANVDLTLDQLYSYVQNSLKDDYTIN